MDDSRNISIISTNIAAPSSGVKRLFSNDEGEDEKSQRLRLSLSRFIHLLPCYKLNDSISRVFLEPESRTSQNFSRGALSQKVMGLLSPNSGNLQVSRATIIRILGHGSSGPVMYAEGSRLAPLNLSQPLDSVSLPPVERLQSSDPNVEIVVEHAMRHVRKKGFAVKFIDVENHDSPLVCLDHAEREVKALTECSFFSILKIYNVLRVKKIDPNEAAAISSLPLSKDSSASLLFANSASAKREKADSVTLLTPTVVDEDTKPKFENSNNSSIVKVTSLDSPISVKSAEEEKPITSPIFTKPQHAANISTSSSSSMEEHESIRNDVLGITMEFEYANNGDLRSEVKLRRKSKSLFAERDVMLIMCQVVMAVYYLHEIKGIIHRDIKTSNILVCSNGLVKLADFGYCKEVDDVDQKMEHSLCGTPYYMSPEMWRKAKYDKKVDIFSMGVVFYELLTLERPFVADSIAGIKKQILTNKCKPITGEERFNKEIVDLVYSMLDVDTEKRPSTLDILCTPIFRRHIGTLLEVIHAEPVNSFAASATSTPRESQLGSPPPQKPPGAAVPRTNRRTMNLTGDEKTEVLNDLFLMYRCVVKALFHKIPEDQLKVGTDLPKTHVFGEHERSGFLATPPKMPTFHQDGPMTPRQVEILFESPILKENKDHEWKNRYIQLVQVSHAEEGLSQFRIRQGFKKSRVAQNDFIEMNFSSFVDCMEGDPKQGPPEGFGFCLLESDGKVQRFAATTEELRAEWICLCIQVIHYNPELVLVNQFAEVSDQNSGVRNSSVIGASSSFNFHGRSPSYDFVPSPPNAFNNSFSSGVDRQSPTAAYTDRTFTGSYHAPQVFTAPTPPQSVSPAGNSISITGCPRRTTVAVSPSSGLSSQQTSGILEDHPN
ncbi:Protein kinase domain/Protein tyrosine kinase/Fungal protein kinase, putative [Angomonas deanei]|uniref:non-specific serine/threonine protein kinase n=1 Tax=Angomonas deanei TaxID=59799 RepID=A0A7G2C403_9TRYP|nr:Protein kinase domain/Protein tyrosine kinase/Fungal protein kinase, putative [Angomonas deanei]